MSDEWTEDVPKVEKEEEQVEKEEEQVESTAPRDVARPAPSRPVSSSRRQASSQGRMAEAETLLRECAEEFDALGRGKTLRKRIANFLRG